MRAAKPCVTSSARPLGRPKPKSSSQTDSNASTAPSFSSVSEGKPTLELAPAADQPFITDEASYESTQFPMDPGWFNSADAISLLNLEYQEGSLIELLGHEKSAELAENHHESANFHADPMDTDNPLGTETSVNSTSEDNETNTISISDDLFSDGDNNSFKILCRICRLNSVLSRQCANLLGRPGRERRSGDLAVDSHDEAGRQQQRQHKQAHVPAGSFGKTLRNMSEFLSILKDDASLHQGHGPDPELGSPSSWSGLMAHTFCLSSYSKPAKHASPANNDVIITLNMLSCYLHLITVVDVTFRNLSTTLDNIPEQPLSSMQMIPELLLEGFQLQHGGLRVKILAQVVKCQLEMIESGLGLPAEYRVTASPMISPLPGGFLGCRDTSMLISVVMGLGEQSALSASLRDNIERVQHHIGTTF